MQLLSCIIILIVAVYVNCETSSVIDPMPVHILRDRVDYYAYDAWQNTSIGVGVTYVNTGENMTFNDASVYCRQWGWRLPVVHDVSQETALKQAAAGFGNAVWVGLNDKYRLDMYQTQRDTWSWKWEDGSAYDYAVTGWDGTKASDLYCVSMKTSGLYSTTACDSTRRVVCQKYDADDVPASERTSDYSTEGSFGSSMVMLDLDLDGHLDLVVGSYLGGAGRSHGIVTTYYGLGNGTFLNKTTAVLQGFGYYAPEIFYRGFVPDPSYKIDNERFGYCIANLGDLDGNLFPAIAVGAPSKGYNQGGAVYLFESDGLGWNPLPYRVYQEDLDKKYSMYGTAVTGGNFNNDLYRDIVIGVPGDSNYVGRIDVLYGNSVSGLPASGFTSHVGVQITGPAQLGNKQSFFGRALAVGDINGDGYDDLVVGAPMASKCNATACSNIQYGAVYIYLGSAVGLPNTTPHVLYGEHLGCNFGFSVAVGDINNDNYADIIVGAPQYGANGVNNEGKIYLYLGGSTVPTTATSSLRGLVSDAYFGYTVSVDGDVDRNGRNDILVGAPFELIDGKRAGAAYVVLVKSDNKLPADKSNQYDVVRITRTETGFGFGSKFLMADFSNNNKVDLIIAAGVGGNNDTYRKPASVSGAGVDYVFMPVIIRDFKAGYTSDWSNRDFEAMNSNCQCDNQCMFGEIRGIGYNGLVPPRTSCTYPPALCSMCLWWGQGSSYSWTSLNVHGVAVGMINKNLVNGKPDYKSCTVSKVIGGTTYYVPCKKSLHSRRLFEMWYTLQPPTESNKGVGANYEHKRYLKLYKYGSLYRFFVQANNFTEGEGGRPNFFPADGMVPNADYTRGETLGWGHQHTDSNSKNSPQSVHNFLFTTELHSKFTYKGNEVFKFCGDDDVWVFINGKLAMDLGGMHSRTCCTVVLNDMANATVTSGDDCVKGLGPLGLVVNEVYDFAMFHAERACCGSNFEVDTTLVLDTQAGDRVETRDVIGDPYCECAASSHGHCTYPSELCQCDASLETGYWSGPQCSVCLDGYTGAKCDQSLERDLAKINIYSENFNDDGLGDRYELMYRFRYAKNTMFDISRNVLESNWFGSGSYIVAANVKQTRDEEGNRMHYYRPLKAFDVTMFSSIEICANFSANQAGTFETTDFIVITLDWNYNMGEWTDEQELAKWVGKSPSMALEGSGLYQLGATFANRYCFPATVPASARTVGVTVAFYNDANDELVGMDDFMINAVPTQARYQYLVADAEVQTTFPLEIPYVVPYSGMLIKGGCSVDKFAISMEVKVAAPADLMLLFRHGDNEDDSAPAVYVDYALHVVVKIGTEFTVSSGTITAGIYSLVQVSYLAPHLYVIINNRLDTKVQVPITGNAGAFFVGSHPYDMVPLTGLAKNIKFSCVDALLPSQFVTVTNTEKIVVVSAQTISKLTATVTGPSSIVILATPQAVTYTVEVTNIGPDNEPNANVLLLMTDFTQFGNNTQTYTLTATAGVAAVQQDRTRISWTLPIDAGVTSRLYIIFNITGYEEYTLTAVTLTGSVGGSVYWGPVVSLSKTTTLSRQANLSIVIPAGEGLKNLTTSGEIIYLKNVVSNSGPSVAYSVEIHNYFPVGWSLVSYNVTGAWARCASVASTVTCTITKIAAVQSTTLMFAIKVGASTVGAYNHSSILIAGNRIEDITSNDNVVWCVTDVRSNATLEIASVSPSDSVIIGHVTPDGRLNTQYLDYTVMIRNLGPADVIYAEILMDETELGLVASEFTVESDWICSNASHLLHCTIPSFLTGTSKMLVLRAPITFASGGDTIVNVTTTLNWHSNVTSNQQVVNITHFDYHAKADVIAGVSATTSVILINSTSPVLVIVRSMGPVPAEAVTLEVFVPDKVDFNSTTDSKCSNAEYTEGSPIGTATGHLITCNLGSLDVGSNYNISFSIGITPYTNSSVYVVSRVNTSVADIAMDNNIASTVIKVSTSTDLKMANILQSTANIYAGQQFGLSLLAMNGGLNAAKDVKIRMRLPSPSVFVSAIAQPNGVCAVSFGYLECEFAASVKPMELVKLSVLLNVPASTAAGLTITYSASVSMFNMDTNPADNQGNITITVGRKSDLSLVMTTNQQIVVAGHRISNTIFIQNLGPSDVSDVKVTIRLPGNSTIVADATIMPSILSCSDSYEGNHTLSCTTLAGVQMTAGQQLTMVLGVRTDPSITVGTIETYGAVGSATLDPVLSNNNMTVSNSLTDPYTTISASFNSFSYGYVTQPISIVVQLSSAGPSLATNALITMTASNEITWKLPVYCSLINGMVNNTVTCELGTIDQTIQGATDPWNKPILVPLTATVPATSAIRSLSFTVTNITSDIVTYYNVKPLTPVSLTYESDVAVALSSSQPATVPTFSDYTYSVTVSNVAHYDDVSNTARLRLSDVVPLLNVTLSNNIVFGSVRITNTSTGGVCVDACGCTYYSSDHRVECQLQKLSTEETVQVVIAGVVAPSLTFNTGILSSSASVKSNDVLMFDKDTTNNVASMTTNIVAARVDPAVTSKVKEIVLQHPLKNLILELSVSNLADTVGVNAKATLNDLVVVLPQYINAIKTTACLFNDTNCKCQYNNNTRVVTCRTNDLEPGESQSISIVAVVERDAAIASQNLNMTVNCTVTTFKVDLNTSNNAVSVNVALIPKKESPGRNVVEKTDNSFVLWQGLVGLGLLAGFVGGLSRTKFFKRHKHDELAAHEREMEDMDAKLADSDALQPQVVDLGLDQDTEFDQGDVWKVANVSGVN